MLEPYADPEATAPAPTGADARTQLVSPPTPDALASIPDPERHRQDDMVPVSRSSNPQFVDGSRRSQYGGGRDARSYEGGRRAPSTRDPRPANRALPDGPPGQPRKRNTGSFRLGRSESPAPRADWNSDRAGRNTREVDLRGPSSPRAPRGRVSEAPRSRPRGGTRDDIPMPAADPIPKPRPRGMTRDDIRLPRSMPADAAPAAAGDGMERTRMLSAIDADAVGGSVGGSVGDGMERTRMVSAVADPTAGGSAEMESTRMLSAIDLATAGAAATPAATPGLPGDDERTRLHGVIDLEQTLDAVGRGAPAPSPSPRGGAGPSPFPSPSPRGGAGPSPFPSPSPRGGAGPSPFPSPAARAGGAPAPDPTPRTDLRKASPAPLAVPARTEAQPVAGAAARPVPVARPASAAQPAPVAQPAQPAPVAAAVPVAPAGQDPRRTAALPMPGVPATPAPVAQPVAAQPVPVAQAAPVAQPAPTPAAPKPAEAVPDYSDKYASYFDARGASGANLTDAIDAIIGEQQGAAPVAPSGVMPTRRRRMNPLIWIVPIVLFVGAIVLVAVLYEGGPTDDVADAAVDDGPALAGVQQVVAELGLTLPIVRGSEPLPSDPPYVVAGADALRVRGTDRILGLSSVAVPEAQVVESPEGLWVRPLRDALGSTPRNQLDLLALALDEQVDARALALFAHSAEKARFEQVGVVVRRVEGAEGLGVFPINTGPSEPPSAGRVMIRVGRLSVTIKLANRDGEQADDDAKIENKNGTIDLDGVESRLADLARANPLVREAVVQTYSDQPIADLVPIFERARSGVDKERFTRLRLIVR